MVRNGKNCMSSNRGEYFIYHICIPGFGGGVEELIYFDRKLGIFFNFRLWLEAFNLRHPWVCPNINRLPIS